MMSGIMKPGEMAVARQPLGKNIPLAMSTVATIEELLDEVFCECRQTEIYSHGSQEDPCDLEPRVTLLAAITSNLLKTQNRGSGNYVTNLNCFNTCAFLVL
jgi:hypothetical protein